MEQIHNPVLFRMVQGVENVQEYAPIVYLALVITAFLVLGWEIYRHDKRNA